jgi:hypothetical protein
MSFPISPSSADEIYPRKVDKLGRPAVENGLRHEDPKIIGLLQGSRIQICS